VRKGSTHGVKRQEREKKWGGMRHLRLIDVKQKNSAEGDSGFLLGEFPCFLCSKSKDKKSQNGMGDCPRTP